MPLVRIKGLGEIGINNDQPRYSISPNAISDGKNVRAFQGRLKSFGGWDKVTIAPIEPYGLFTFSAPDRVVYWLEAGLTGVYVYNGVSHTELTRLSGPYTMNEYSDRWTGGIQHTLGFLCNGHADGPQVWKSIDLLTRLEDMTYDPSAGPGSKTWQDLSYTAYAMRPFKDTIVAMNLRRGATSLPSTVQWCDFIAPGTTEPNWVPSAENSAREVSLGETAGNCIDGAPMRDDFIIYKEDSVFRMSFTGDANQPFAFERLPEYVRIINRNCIGVSEEFHVCVSRDDVQIFDGNVFRSILTNRMREYYQSRMFSSRIFTTFVSMLDAESEAWICFPTQGDIGELKSPDLAIVWNYANNTISLTDIPQCRDMDQGRIVGDTPDSFDDNSLTFDQDYARFDESPFERSREFMVGAHATNVSVFGESPTDGGTPRECLAERMGLVLQDGKAGFPATARVHTLRTMRPYLQSTGPVRLQIGAQMTSGAPIYWEPEQEFNPATQEEVHGRATGRYFGWRIRSQADVRWDLTDIEFEYEVRRRR